MKIRVFLCALQLLFAVSSVCFGKLGTSVILLLHTRCLSVRQTTTSLFISMSFVTLLDYSVVDVRVEGRQSVVMMWNKMRIAT